MQFRKFMKQAGLTVSKMEIVESKVNIDIDEYIECIQYDFQQGGINNLVGWLIRCVDGTYDFSEHPVIVKRRRDKEVDESIKRDRERYERDRASNEQVRNEQDRIIDKMSADDRERNKKKLCKKNKEQFVLDIVIEGEYIREQGEKENGN